MKKSIFSTILFIIFVLFIFTIYLSFFGHETQKFNKIIKNEIEKKNKDLKLDFNKISILLDLKNVTLFIKFIEPKIFYRNIGIPLNYLRTDVSFDSIIKNKISIKKIQISTNPFKFSTIKQIIKKVDLNDEDFKIIKKANIEIKNLELELDENLKLKKNYIIEGVVSEAELKLTKKYEILELNTNFVFEDNNLSLSSSSWILKLNKKTKYNFFNGEAGIKKIKNDYNINFNFETKNIANLLNISVMNFNFLPNEIINFESKIIVKKNSDIHFRNLSILDKNNKFIISDLILNKNFLFKDFKSVEIKTQIDNEINNHFRIINKKKQINFIGNVFDAKNIVKEINKDNKNNILETFNKDIEIDFKKILKGVQFPIKNFN